MTDAPPTVEIVGVPVHRVDMAGAIDWIAAHIASGRAEGSTFQVATVNLDFLTNAIRDRAFAELLVGADLAIADGTPLVWASRLLGHPISERVAGSDMVPALAARCARDGTRLYLFGAGPGIAARAAEALRTANPGLVVEGDEGPTLQPDLAMPESAIAAIKAFDADVIGVALGNPKQEWWIHRHRAELGIPVLIGIGGSLDMLLGEKKRAPAWVGRAGMEWVYRAVQEPGRLGRRYALDIVVVLPRLALQIGRAWWRRLLSWVTRSDARPWLASRPSRRRGRG